MGDIDPRNVSSIKREHGSSSNVAGRIQKPTITLKRKVRKKIDPSLLYEGSMVRLVIGTEKQEFMVYRNLIRSLSKYFEDLIPDHDDDNPCGPFKARQTRPVVFSFFNRWMYSGKIFADGTAGNQDDIPVLVELWLFAASVRVPKLQNATLTSLGAIMETSESPGCLGVPLIVSIWDIDRKSQLCNYAIDWFTWRVDAPLHIIDEMIFDDRDRAVKLYQGLKRRMHAGEWAHDHDPTRDISHYFVDED